MTTNFLVAPAADNPTIRLYLGSQRKRQHRPIAQLIALRAEINYTWLIWADGQRVLLPRTIKYVAELMPPGQFIRLRRDYAANLAFISSIDQTAYDCLTVVLQTGERIRVTRRRIREVRERLAALPAN